MHITVKQLKQKIDSKEDFILLDIRTPQEVEIAQIPNSLYIEMKDVANNLDKLPKDKEIVVYCHTGSRSAFVTNWLINQGYDAKNLLGGIDAYSTLIDASLKKY